MKKRVLFLIGLLSVSLSAVFAQGNQGNVSGCAPMKNGKVCYQDEVQVKELDKSRIFDILANWARENYGKDVFNSNVTSNKTNGTIAISSKIEILLNDTEKTLVKYRLNMHCTNSGYTAEVTNISYQYDPKNEKKYKTYTAESVIANDGASNTIPIIKDPKLFCNATFFFAEGLFADIMKAINEAD